MTDTEKLTLLIKILKRFAESKHCYNVHGDDYSPSAGTYDDAFEDGSEFGEILLARTLLEQIGENYKIKGDCD